jgi:nicotinate-nucleotide adenylyltransferase
MMKIGLFGGSFNPPHQGHVYISELAIKKLGLNQLWWIPNKYNPLKKQVVFDDFDSRFKKCQQMTLGSPKIKVKNFKNDSVYTEELLTKLKSKYKNHQFYWIMGADNLVDLHRWKNFKKLIKMVIFVVFSRQNFLSTLKSSKAYNIYQGFLKNNLNKPDKSPKTPDKISDKAPNKTSGQNLPRFLIFRIRNLDISSTQIRKRNV